MMTLYSGPLSLFTAKVRIALAEKGIDYERVEVPFSRETGYEPKHPGVRTHNPKEQVPVFVVSGEQGQEDLVLWDSTIIVEYLDEICPEPRLLPTDPIGRARCRMLELHADEVFFPNVLTLIRNVFYVGADGGGDPDAIARAKSELARHYADLDRRLLSHDWIGGDAMTAADVTYRLAALFAASLGAAPPAELDGLNRWIARIDARASVASELADLISSVAAVSR